MGCACGGNSPTNDGARTNQRNQQQPRQVVIDQSVRRPVLNVQEAQRQSNEEEKTSISKKKFSKVSSNF